MAQQIHLEILIDGSLKITPFTSLSVHQQINDHHYFEVRFNHDVKSGNSGLPISKYQEYLGKSISITFGKDVYNLMKDHKEQVFKGVITEIVMADSNQELGSIIIKGYSPSILLETNENCNAFLNMKMEDIVKSLSKDAPGNVLTFNVSPKYSAKIPYMVQYNESNYSFIKRLAGDYGEWLLYNGKELYFGKPSSLPEVKISGTVDITEMRLSIRVKPLNHTISAYSIKTGKDNYKAASSSTKVTGLGIFGDDAVKKSDNTYLVKTEAPAMLHIQDKTHLDSYVKSKKGSEAANLVVLQASCDNPGVQVGTIVDVDNNGENVGKYIVTQAVHNSDGLGNYSNVFEAIPADVEFLPSPAFKRPLIEPQIGKVVDNQDPDSLRRVKVQLMWHKDSDKSNLPWIPNMSLAAGGTNAGDKNNGFCFTPEIDDFVMVGFTENDPSKPFVMGSIFTEDNRTGGSNDKNNEKTIRTRSGNTIFFRDDDDNKKQEIRIETDAANFVSILVANNDGKIEIQTNKEILIKSENISIESTKDITMKAEGNIIMKANKNIEMEGKEVSMKASTNLKAEAGSNYTIKGTNVEISATANAEVKANAKATVNGSAQLELQGGAQASLKGAIVMIN